MENVIYLISAFDVHAQLRDDLHACLERAIAHSHMLPSKSRQLEQMARKIGISQLRGMVLVAEQLLAA